MERLPLLEVNMNDSHKKEHEQLRLEFGKINKNFEDLFNELVELRKKVIEDGTAITQLQKIVKLLLEKPVAERTVIKEHSLEKIHKGYTTLVSNTENIVDVIQLPSVDERVVLEQLDIHPENDATQEEHILKWFVFVGSEFTYNVKLKSTGKKGLPTANIVANLLFIK